MHPRLLLCLALAACGGDPSTTTDDDTGGDASSTTGGDPTSSGTSTTSDDGTTSSSSGDESTTGAAAAPPLGPWRIMAFNIMCQSCGLPGYEDWDLRIPHIGDTIRRHDPDLLGTQELFSGENVDQLAAEIPGYTSVWFKKPDPDSLDYADAAIWYRTGMFEEVEHGFYWLSPKPDVPYSTGFSTPQFARLVAWARLRSLADDGAEFVFATTHFDNNTPSQELSAPLVIERTASQAERWPVILVGDFNSRPDSVAYATLAASFTNTFDIAGAWRSDTNLDPGPAYEPSQRIDHMFVAGAPWLASDWTVDQWGYGPNLHATSDHWALSVLVEVP